MARMAAPLPVPATSLPASAECVVIGGGVMGCGIALRLAQAGVRTVVLERAIPGAEASSAAGGILAAQEEAEGAGPVAALSLASRARIPALVDELRALTAIDVGYRETGCLRLCADDAQVAATEDRVAWQRAAGLRLAWVRGNRALRELEPSIDERWEVGLHFPDDHQLEPRAYVRALSQAAALAGATFVTGAYVRRVVHEGGRVVAVDVEGGRVATPRVVVAAGSWTSLVDGLGLPPAAVRPMRGQIAMLETRPPAVRGTIFAPGGYLVGRADGRVLCGSTMELAGYDRSVTAGGLAHVLGLALSVIPGLARAPVVETWANFRPTTDDRRPILGASAVDGLFLATGHFRNGILLSPITAEIIRDLVVHGRSAHDVAPFAPDRVASAG